MSDDLEDVLVWAALMILLAATLGVSFANLGTWSTALSFGISALKAGFIVYFFMHLRRDKGMTRIFAMAGAAWLVILISILFADFVTRSWLPYPSRWPIFVKLRPALNENYEK